jgi:hypothetical protein
MRLRSLLLGTAVFLAIAVPAFAQGVGNNCDISGTWYGGSDPASPYLWTITPMAGGRYSSVAQQAYPFSLIPQYAGTTNWSIDIMKVNARKYEGYGMSYWVYRWTGLDQPQLPELDVVRSRLRLVDCNTIENTIDVFVVYFSFDSMSMTPFVTPPDLDILAEYTEGEPIVETYRRMPTSCPACPFPSASGAAAQMPARQSAHPVPKRRIP